MVGKFKVRMMMDLVYIAAIAALLLAACAFAAGCNKLESRQ